MAKLKKGTIPRPRSDSKLERLSPEVQAALRARLGKLESYASIQKWLKSKYGESVSAGTLSKFYQKRSAPVVEEKPLRDLLAQVERRLAKIETHLGIS